MTDIHFEEYGGNMANDILCTKNGVLFKFWEPYEVGICSVIKKN